MDYYQLLHVQEDAPPAMIKAAYRTLMQKLKMHPDLGGDVSQAALINEAYATLSNPAKRAEYDRTRPKASATPEAANDESTQAKAQQAPPRPQQRQYKASPKPQCLFCKTEILGVVSDDTDCRACGSPLQRLQRESGEQGQRAIARMPASHDIEVRISWPGGPVYGRLVDMSLHGAQFYTDAVLEAGAVVQMRSQYFTAVARVIRQVAEQRYAAEFTSVRFRDSGGAFVSVQA